MKRFLREIKPVADAVRSLRALFGRRRASKASARYLAAAASPRLHLGCGGNVLKDWLNVDSFTGPLGVWFVDARRRLPFADASFDYILCEHMIEHVSLEDARRVVEECRRVLRPKGVFRVVTPDLRAYVSLFINSEDAFSRAAIEEIMSLWITPGFYNAKTYPPFPGVNRAAFVLNDIFLNYEHRFIYDELTLTALLHGAGFSRTTRRAAGESPHAALHGTESHISPHEVRLTLTLEAE